MRTSAVLLTEYHADIWAKLDGALVGRRRLRGAEGRAAVRLACRQSRRRRALPAHDGRGALAGDAGDRRGLRFLAVQAHRRRRRRPRHRCCRRFSPPIRDVRGTLFDLPEGHRRRQARRGRSAARRDASSPAMCSSPCRKAATLYLLRHLLHDYDDDDCLRMLEQRPPRHEAGRARAGAGENRADRRHAGSRPLARSARDAADRRARAHACANTPRCSRARACGSAACCRPRIRRSRVDRSGRRRRAARLRAGFRAST